MEQAKKVGKKTLSFAIVHFTVALTVGWIITGSFIMGSLIACIEPAVNTVAYAIHEHVWNRKAAVDTLSAVASVGI